jgi:hypothetical protein
MAGDLQRGLPVLRVFDDAMPRKAANPSTKNPPIPKLHAELRELILSARERVAQTVNSGLTLLYWQVGDRIRRHVLREKRAAYGEEIVSALATQLAEEFGAGFSRRNLFNMVRFSEVFSDFEIVQALTAQLGWTHFTHIIRLEDTVEAGVLRGDVSDRALEHAGVGAEDSVHAVRADGPVEEAGEARAAGVGGVART